MASAESTLTEAPASHLPAHAAPAGVDRLRLGLLAAGHAVTDSYGFSLLAPMFPDIARRLHLTHSEIGGLPVMMGLSASLAQPLFGWVSDRHPRWCLVAFGPLVAAVMMGFVGQASGYWQLAALMFLAGLGVGAFHPQGAALARQAGLGGGLAMSVFTVGGNVGFGLAPVLGPFYMAVFGLERFYLAAIPGILFAAVMLAAFYAGRIAPESRKGRSESGAPSAADRPGNPLALAALTATVVVRSGVQIGMTTFLAFLVEQRFPIAAQPTMKSAGISAFLLASALAGPLGGHLSDRFGRKRLMVWSFLLAPWPLLLGLGQGGVLMIAFLAAGAFILMLPHPGNVVMAQEFMPRSAGIAASMITGLAWGIAQILVWPLGRIADATSVPAALTGLALVPLLGVLLVAPIPEARRVSQPEAFR